MVNTRVVNDAPLLPDLLFDILSPISPGIIILEYNQSIREGGGKNPLIK